MLQMLGLRGKTDSSSPSSSSISVSQNTNPNPSSIPSESARPVRLVYCDDKGKFRIDPDAFKALQLVNRSIGVVSIGGRTRQGKSFILNQLLGWSSGFQVASTHRPCTKGLWMWSAPLKRTALDGTEYNLLLLDSEGIDTYDQTVRPYSLCSDQTRETVQTACPYCRCNCNCTSCLLHPKILTRAPGRFLPGVNEAHPSYNQFLAEVNGHDEPCGSRNFILC